MDTPTEQTSELAWRAVATSSGILGGLAVRKLLSALWTNMRDDGREPPLNPADRDIGWVDALLWAVAAGVGAGVARLVSQRLAAAGWEAATGSSPPGIDSSE